MGNMKRVIRVGICILDNHINRIKSCIKMWQKSKYFKSKNIELNLLIADNKKANEADAKLFGLVDSIYYIGGDTIKIEVERLISEKVIGIQNAELLFGAGYAKKQNAILYFAVKYGMDGLFFPAEENTVAPVYHCDYNSLDPDVRVDPICSENDFKLFMELTGSREKAQNSFIDLRSKDSILPFFSLPVSRGEDGYLSKCRSDSETIAQKFFKKCINWIRYKPILSYIANPASYESRIKDIKAKLQLILPKVSRYFKDWYFMMILHELNVYDKNVKNHYRMFKHTTLSWNRLMQFI